MGRIRRDPKASASTAFVTVAAVALILAMIFADGFRATSYELKSAGVWVVNRDKHRFGRVNARIMEQDGLGAPAVVADSVLQDGEDVFVVLEGGLAVQRVSPASLDAVGDPVQMREGSDAAVGGGRLAVIDAEGNLRMAPISDAASLSVGGEADASDDGADSDDPAADDAEDSGVALREGPGARLAIGRRGEVVVASPEQDRLSVLRDDSDEAEVLSAELDGDVQVSFAGRTPVALSGNTLVVPDGRSRKVAGGNPKLQLPSDDPDHVLVATDAGILSFPIDGDGSGDPEVLGETTDTPGAARPVNINGCTYAAWAGAAPTVLYQCGSQRRELAYPGDAKLGDRTELAWQVNGDYAVLNDLSTGLVLVVSDGELVKADQWDPTEVQQTGQQKSEDRTPDPNFTPEENTTPEAKDDAFGARAGLPSILPVLDNDKDADGDVLAIVGIDQVPEGTTVQVVRGGTAIQVTPAQGLPAGGSVRFTYRITDGWSTAGAACDTCEATVAVSIADPTKNFPPALKKDRPAAHLSVGVEARATYPVLDDWIDPEGDPIVLSGATIDPTVAKVSAQSDGILTYVDLSAVPGEHVVAIQVADLPLVDVPPATADGSLAVTVEGGNSPPVARSDYASTAPGLPVVVWPLRNDTDADGDQLNFTLIPAGAVPPEAHQNGDGSVTVTPSTAGTLQFGYEVNDGHNAAVPARIRVDVLEPSAAPPSAGLDLVILPAPPLSGARSSRSVDLLENDVSPSGNVLVVTRVTPHGDRVDGLEYQLIEHRRLVVSYQGRIDSPVSLDYTLSDGNTTTIGRIVVVSAASDANLPPSPVDDDVDVRVGDVVSVPVLANDIDPEGAELHLRSAEITRGTGVAFVSGQRVRFLAPSDPGTVNITYTVGDDPEPGFGDTTGRLTITVRDSVANSAPVPPPVDARAVAGRTIKITIPLAGIDPDGDSVTLLGLGLESNIPQAPKLGRILEVGLDTFTYQAFDTPGTDVFRYRVVDTGGPSGEPLEAEGVIRVGVAANDGQNSPPSPRSDQFTLRPGPARLDVLANDFDPDGDTISLEGAQGPDELGVRAEGGRIVAELPEVDEPTSFGLSYQVADEAGLPGRANVTVTVDPDAAGAPPIARDDLAEPDADPKATRVTVNVLENDDDPDGDPGKLDVEVVEGSGVDATSDGKRLSVAVSARTQLVAYRITDEQGLTATAIVRVRPAGAAVDLPPVLRPDARVLSKGTETGATVTVVLEEVAIDPEGKPLRLDGGNVTGVNGTAEVVDATSFKFTPSPYNTQTGEGPRGPGAASVSFIVSDAEEGKLGQRAVLTLPVDVELDAPALPVWTSVSPLEVSVYKNDEPRRLDLRQAVTDEDTEPSALRFEIIGGTPSLDGVEVDIVDDYFLTAVVSGAPPEPNVEVGYVEVRVTDDTDVYALTDARVPIRTVATDRPPAALATVDVEAESGKPTEVDVLAGATNPFDEAIDEALKVDPASIRTKSGKGDAFSGDSRHVTFTPSNDPTSVGTATVSFEVVDIVGRRVPGTVAYTVSSVPGAPGAPTVRQLSASSVEVAWAGADKHGKEIEKYTVTDNLGRGKDCGVELFCPVEGLTPGETYTFTVVATNERGDGPASQASPQIRPDECPAAPTDVQLTFDPATNPTTGGQLVASWVKPENKGTAIEGYEVRTVPASSTPLLELVTGTSVTLPGLTNGTPHTVIVRAKNRCDGDGLGAPAESSPQIPAGVPDAPTMISATDAADPTGGRIQLTWTPPTATGAVSDHGDRVSLYTITATEGVAGFGTGGGQTYQPANLRTNPNGSVTADLSVNRDLDAYRFTVSATNKAGTSRPSAPSAAQTARGKPSVPDLLSVVFDPNATTTDGQVNVSFKESTDAGDNTISYFYKVDSGAWTEVPGNIHTYAGASRSFSLTGLTYGQQYNVRLKARNDSYESAEDGPVPSSAQGGGSSAIYGLFDPPSVNCNGSGTSVSCNWTAGTSRGNTVTLQLSGSPINDSVSGSGNRTVGLDYGQSGTQSIAGVDTRGRNRPGNSSPWQTAARPSVSASIGSRSSDPNGCVYGDAMAKGDTQGCYNVRISMNNYVGSHTVRCYMSMSNNNPAIYKEFTYSGSGTFEDCSFSSAGRWVFIVVDGYVEGGNSSPAQYNWAAAHHSGDISNEVGGIGWPTN